MPLPDDALKAVVVLALSRRGLTLHSTIAIPVTLDLHGDPAAHRKAGSRKYILDGPFAVCPM